MDDFDDLDELETEEAPAASSSLLATLRQRQSEAREGLFFDYPVPKLEPLHVRFRPATAAEIKLAGKVAERNRKADDGAVIAEAGLLARCCLGIFDKDEHGNPKGDPDEWLTFGPELAEVLGLQMERPSGSAVVRALYLRDGDVTSTFSQLVVDSGYKLNELEESEAGN